MRRLKSLLLVLCLIASPSAMSNQAGAAPATLTIFAATSLKDCLEDLAALHLAEAKVRVRVHTGASSLVARQIEDGAPADVFFSAHESQMTKLATGGHLMTNTITPRLSNRLVIVVGTADQPALKAPSDLAIPAIRRIALAETRTVPAGVYARAYFTRQKLWSTLEPKIVPCENVRAALVAVETGNADAAVVYQTDAQLSKHTRVACVIPATDTPEIRYSLAVLKHTRHPDAARLLVEFLKSDRAARVFQRYGFIVLPAA